MIFKKQKWQSIQIFLLGSFLFKFGCVKREVIFIQPSSKKTIVSKEGTPPNLESKRIDYYSKLIDDCPIEEEDISNRCRKALQKTIVLDDSFDEEIHQRERVFEALHFIMQKSIRFSSERLVLGLVPVKEIVPRSLQEELGRYPHEFAHQVLFNYVLNHVKLFRLIPPKRTYSAFFDAHDQSISLVKREGNAVEDAFTLIHEARHSSDNPHSPSLLYCTLALEGARGWEIAYAWGLLQGEYSFRLYPSQIAEIVKLFITGWDFIVQIPKSVEPLKEKLAEFINEENKTKWVSLFEELNGISFPLALPFDAYSQVRKDCQGLKITSLCKEQLDQLIEKFLYLPPNKEILNPEEVLRLENILFELLNAPLFLRGKLFDQQGKLLHRTFLEKYLSEDVLTKALFEQGWSYDQILFNYFISGLKKSSESQLLANSIKLFISKFPKKMRRALSDQEKSHLQFNLTLSSGIKGFYKNYYGKDKAVSSLGKAFVGYLLLPYRIAKLHAEEEQSNPKGLFASKKTTRE